MAVHPFNEFNLDPALAEAVAGVEPNFLIEGILRLNDPGEIPLGFGVVCRFDRIYTGRFRAADAWAIRQNPNVASLKAARPIGTPELERLPEFETLINSRSQVRQRAVPPYTGRGSVVAALDFGLDFAHPNFRNADGSTRVLAFWNQGSGYDISHPNSYGYGRVFSREEINRALEVEDPYGALGYHPSISDTGNGSHGTHTLDIAAGNGRVGAASAAAEADILFVHLSTPRLDAAGNLGDSVRLLEGLDFVSRTAGDRPWAVNLSVGRTAGSKDGTSLVEQGMHECLRMRKGRAIVQSAGNYRSADLTVEGWIQEGESRELLWIIQPNDPTPNELDIWYSAKDRLIIEIQPPHSTESIRVALGRMQEILYDGDVIGRIYHRKNDPNNGDNHCEIYLRATAPAGTWIVLLIGEYVISGRFHAWIERDIGQAGAQSRFTPEIASERYTLGTIATSPLVITVGAYDAHDPAGPVAPFSSQGPTRDERLYKPELLAPGVSVVAARSIPRGETHQQGLTVARSGTSMAAPHVTGLVAAMFEAAGRSLSIDEIRDRLRLSAVLLDAEEHGAYWGRVNPVEAVRLTGGEPLIEEIADRAPEQDCPCRRGPPLLLNETSTDGGAYERQAIMGGIAADLVVQAELALSRVGGAGRETETMFLRQLLGSLGWQPSGAAPSPAKLFRRAAGGDAQLGGVLKIIGAPFERASETLRPGDWIVRVTPGTGDAGHVSVLVSNELMSRSRIRNEGIPAESSLPGYYGTVIEGGAYPHDRSTPFARRFLDSGGRVPPHSVILRPTPETSENVDAYTPPAWFKIEHRGQAPSVGEEESAPASQYVPPSWFKVEHRSAAQSEAAEDVSGFVFKPTANLTDFSSDLAQAWHNFIQFVFKKKIKDATELIANNLSIVGSAAAKNVRFFSPASDTVSSTLTPANVRWSAFPISLGSPSPAVYEAADLPGSDGLRAQDEYCEWQVFRNSKKQIVRVVFSSEPPEYYRFLHDPGDATLTSSSQKILVAIYQKLCGTTAITLADLEKGGGYDPANKWNKQHCIHLQNRFNTLQAQVDIAAHAAIVRSTSGGALITDIKMLVACDPFGEVSRQSDPAIGAAVNGLARENRFITLENPVGLYMTSLDTSGWTTPDGVDPQTFWKVLRGSADKDAGKSMIVRAEYSVPAALKYTVSDIQIGGEAIHFGSQIAEHLEMRLGALAGPKNQNIAGKKLAAPTPVPCP
jgi:subtilisin family serine protease